MTYDNYFEVLLETGLLHPDTPQWFVHFLITAVLLWLGPRAVVGLIALLMGALESWGEKSPYLTKSGRSFFDRVRGE